MSLFLIFSGLVSVVVIYQIIKKKLYFLNFIYKTISLCHQTDIEYLDFHKAFDMAPHNQLLTKLWKKTLAVTCGNGLKTI